MRRTALLLASAASAAALAILLASGVALALPSEAPDYTPMLNGPVRTIAEVGPNTWVGGNFTQVKNRDGTVLANVSNVAVFDTATGGYVDIAPRLGAGRDTTNVRDIDVYGSDVVIGGDFPGPTSTQRNLVVADGTTGEVVRWFNNSPQKMQSVLAAPGMGRVYGGGVSLQAFDFEGGKKLWDRAKTTVNPDIRTHTTASGYRDLELDGSTVWGACACDAVDGNPAKALVKLSAEGNHDVSWVLDGRTGSAAFGISVAHYGGSLYLGAGGNDFLAAYYKADGKRQWVRDTSGSAQVVEIMGNQLVLGGHFLEVADQPADRCGFRSSNNAATLDPYGECQRRNGLAAYSFSGTLEPNWDPVLSGKYNLAWALHPDATTGRLHVGGEFTRVGGNTQAYYTRLGEVDTTIPETTIVSSPPDTAGASAAFDFVSSTPGSMFECSLDGSDFAPCEAPREYAGLPAGEHDFRVRATDASGNIDPTPAQATWTVDTAAPVAKAPTRNLAAGSAISNSTVPVNLSWSATDSGSGVVRYQLQQSTNGGAFTDVALLSETATSVNPSLEAGKTYQFQVRAQDGAGNWGAWKTGPAFAVDLRQEDYQAVSYSGTWALRSTPTASGGYVKHASAAGARARFSFAGKNVAWVASMGSNRGKAEVWVDGAKAATVDLYAATAQPRKVQFARSWGVSGNHTLEVRVLGTKRAASTGKQVDVDAFVALR